MRELTALVVASLLALISCRSEGVHEESVPSAANPASAPTAGAVVASDEVESIWGYLSAKYDADGDGTITAAEYSREGTELARIDRNDDGVVTADDFARGGRMGGSGGMSDEARQRMRAMYSARAVVLAYFQADPEADGLTQDAMIAGFALLDMDDSGEIDESEFACATDELPWGGPGDAWELLLASVDDPGDGDGRLSQAELETYHGRMSRDGVMTGPPGSTRREDRAVASDGAPVGEAAPDFELSPPEGGETVRLSEFSGERPVALVFGSYT